MLNVINIALNIGKLIKTFKDVENAISDVVQGKADKQDAINVMNGFLTLVDSGIINIPGLNTIQVQKCIAEIQSQL